MKLAITSSRTTLDAQVDPRFGRCQYFIIFDTETKQFEAVRNEAGLSGSGAGIQASQMMKDKGVEVVLTGNVGPNASSSLNAAKIGFVVGVSGTVSEAITKFQTGEYKLADKNNVAPHFGFKEE
jgi:predicted Fe-Mo cluster-binding NifX family protein